jgi:small subunit ribosomal protein S8
MTDPIADMLTRIRNAQKARKESVTMPASRVKLAIAEVLQQEGYIDGIETEQDGVQRSIKVGLKYHKSEPVIEKIERVSRPGLRVYAGACPGSWRRGALHRFLMQQRRRQCRE